MSARPSQSPVEVLPGAKRLSHADAHTAIMKTIATTLVRRGLDAETVRARMATYAAIAAEDALRASAGIEAQRALRPWSKRVPL